MSRHLDHSAVQAVIATDSESNIRTALSIGWGGEIHIKFGYPDEEAQAKSA